MSQEIPQSWWCSTWINQWQTKHHLQHIQVTAHWYPFMVILGMVYMMIYGFTTFWTKVFPGFAHEIIWNPSKNSPMMSHVHPCNPCPTCAKTQQHQAKNASYLGKKLGFPNPNHHGKNDIRGCREVNKNHLPSGRKWPSRNSWFTQL